MGGRIAVIAALVLAAGGASAYAALASNGQSDGQGGGRVLHVHERGLAVNVVQAPSGAPVGNHYVFSADILDDGGNVIGRDGADCVTTNPDGTVVCTIGMRLPGGELTFSGLANGPDNVFAITGGTGIYRGARGEAHSVDTSATTSDVTITVTG